MERRDPRALSGALFVVLVLIAFIALGGDTPDGKDAAGKVVSYYGKHDTREIIAAVVLSLGAVVLVFFAATIKERLAAAASARSMLPEFAFGSGIVAAGGFLAAAAIHFALADYADDIDPTAVQALNALDSDFFLPFAIGVVAFVLGVSLFTLMRARVLAAWLGWIGVTLFVVSFTPVGFIGFGLAGIWIIVVSILLYLRGEDRQPPEVVVAGAGV